SNTFDHNTITSDGTNLTGGTKGVRVRVVTPLIAEVQSLWNDATSGMFSIVSGKQRTGSILFNAPASLLQTRLSQIKVNAVVSGSGRQTDPWLITFTDSGADVPQLTTDDYGLNLPTLYIEPAGTGSFLNNTQKLWTMATGGTFALNFSGQVT